MNFSFEKNASSTVLAMALCAASIAMPTVSNAQGAAAEDAESNDAGEIVVTALRKEQKLQDVPVAIAAFDNRMIESRQAVQLSDLARYTPGAQVNYPYGEGGPPNFVIRGISSTDYSPNQSKPIAIYVDEGIRNLQAFEAMPLFDVERVEILRGPQGALYGKNATGGAANIVSKKPGFNTEGYATASYGNFNRVRLQGAVQTPLIADVLSVRVAGIFVQDEGVFKNLTPGLGDLGQTKNFALRASLEFKPSPDFEATLRYNHVRIGGRNYAPFAANIDFNNPSILFPGNNLSALPGSTRAGVGFFENATSNTPKRAIHSDGFNLLMNLDVTDQIKATSVTTYDWGRWSDIADSDGMPVRADDPIETRGRNIKQFVQDLRITSSFDGPFNFQAGVLYTHDTVDTGFSYSLLTDPGCGPACSFGFTPTGTGLVQSNDFNQKRDSYSGYLRADLKLADTLSVYGGIRVSKDKVSVSDYSAFFGDNSDPVAIQTIANYAARRSFDNTSFELGFDWKPTDDVMIYGAVREGYRTGAVNSQGFSDISEITFAPPETARTYEVGVKSEWLNKALTVNVALFQTDYKNQQVIVPEAAGALFPLRSISDARIRGFEGEVIIRPSDAITLNAGISLLDPNYRGNAVVTGNSGVAVAGNQMINAAKSSLNLNGDFVLARPGNGTVDFNLNATYTSRVYFDVAERLNQPSYWLANARIAYNSDRFSFGVGVKNLFDKKYFTYGLDLQFVGFDFYQRGVPRMFAADATFRF